MGFPRILRISPKIEKRDNFAIGNREERSNQNVTRFQRYNAFQSP